MQYRSKLNDKITDRCSCSVNIHCMPVAGPWRLDEAALATALGAGKITRWEHEFYTGNHGKGGVSVKQAPIKSRIEERVMRWVSQGDDMQKPAQTDRS